MVLEEPTRGFIQEAITQMRLGQVYACGEATQSWTPVTLLGVLLQTGGCVGDIEAPPAAFLEHRCNQAGWHTQQGTLLCN